MALVMREDDGKGLCTLTLNRPEKFNALSSELFIELDRHLAALEGETDRIGCVVLRGAGKAFCSGADLSAARDGKSALLGVDKPGVITRLQCLPQPVIAAIQGLCYTGGLELALAADFIVASDAARFADTHGKWGFVGGWGMSQRLPRRIGWPQAKRMMMTARVIDATEAAAIGLVDLYAETPEFESVLATFVDELLANSWFTNRETKRLLRDSDGLSLRDGLAYEAAHHPGSAPDVAERLARFGKPQNKR